MPGSSDVVNAPIVLLGLPDLLCVKSVQDLVQQLPNFLVAAIPTSITNVIIGAAEPLDTQRSSFWIRTSNSGGFIGFYLFTGGSWQQIFPVPNGIQAVFRNSGDSIAPPPGYTRLDNLSPLIMDPATVAALQTTWIPDGAAPGEYLYYQALFTGF